ncbi:MAG: hypothetical protein ACREGR_02555, partial [Minisyncoccia bacterium]
VATGDTSTLSWTTTNATSFSIDQGIGSVTPVASGSVSTSPLTATTTFTGTAEGTGGTVHCAATVIVTTTPPPVPVCTLTASPTAVATGDTSTLSWTTTNATSFSIDQGIGSVTPVASGSTSTPAITTDTTFTGTATGPGGTVTCTAPVSIQGGGGGPTPACTLSASPSQVNAVGDTATLTWTSSNITSFFIDNGVGSTTPVAGGSTTTAPINANTTFTGTGTGPYGTVTCSASVTIPTGGGGGGCTSSCCSGSCGGGGGGGPSYPNILLSALPHVGTQPLAYLYLSQIPYTGLDLGPVGTVLYWLALIGWCLAAAYLVLFGVLPWLAKQGRQFGAEVAVLVNAQPVLAPAAVAVALPPSAVRVSTPMLTPRHSAYEGFKSFASGTALTIDDIVKGLSRVPAEASMQADESAFAPLPKPNVEPIYENVEPVYQNVEPVRAAAPAMFVSRADTKPTTKPESFPPEVPDFLSFLIAGNREAVFGIYRSVVRSGADGEAFLAQVACALDDAYRARLEGAPVHAEVKRYTDAVATPVLEKLVTALSTAVDSSYSIGITGGKLALTRALATLGA